MQPEQLFFDAPNPPRVFGENEGSHRLSYYTWGEESAAKTAICVHGMTRNGRDFDFLARALVQQGYRVIALEMAGRGGSEYLADPAAYSYDLYCADVMAFLDSHKLTDVDFIGTSMGGIIGMMLAANDSTKPRDQYLIGRLVMNDIGSFIPKASLMRIGEYIGQEMEFESLEVAQQRYKEVMKTFGVFEPEHWKHVVQHAFTISDDGACRYRYDENIGAAFWKNGKQIRMPDMNLGGLWHLIVVPTFVIRGADSDLLLATTFEDMKQSPHVKASAEFSGVGHAPMLMNDEQIATILGFLT